MEQEGRQKVRCERLRLTFLPPFHSLLPLFPPRFVPFIKTLYIVLEKKRLIFLHWYHHLTTFLYCWHAYALPFFASFFFGGGDFCFFFIPPSLSFVSTILVSPFDFQRAFRAYIHTPAGHYYAILNYWSVVLGFIVSQGSHSRRPRIFLPLLPVAPFPLVPGFTLVRVARDRPGHL